MARRAGLRLGLALRHGALRVFALMLALQIAAALPAGAQSADGGASGYALQPGDSVQLTMLGLPLEPMVAQIGIDGRVTFPYLGRFTAAGRTLEELQETIGLAATGNVVSIYTPAGERLQLVLDGSGVFLSVSSYRPIYMAGDVARRGAIDFAPGMTVRAALASVGGASEVPELFERAIFQAPGQRARFRTLATEHADAVVTLWGIDARLAGDPAFEAPSPAQVSISPDAFARFVAAERGNVEFALQDFAEREAALVGQIGALNDRIERFGDLLANQEQILDFENEQLAQVQSLIERELSVASRLNEARESVLNASSSVLGAQSALADLTLTRQQLQRELDALSFTREGTLRAQRAEIVPRVMSLATRLEAARQEAELNGVILDDTGAREPSIAYFVTRKLATKEDAVTSPATLDTALLPGDIVDVEVTFPEPYRVPDPEAQP
ncbi:MAG: polysaccharide biosynthesis/export family protein [Pseudomonadota bacterium]